jgi:hypothetical protein
MQSHMAYGMEKLGPCLERLLGFDLSQKAKSQPAKKLGSQKGPLLVGKTEHQVATMSKLWQDLGDLSSRGGDTSSRKITKSTSHVLDNL